MRRSTVLSLALQLVFTHTVKKLAEYLQGINTKGKDQYN
jgi:hypothetical protein